VEGLLTVALPFFAVIVLGYGAARGGLLDPHAVAGLNAFVFWFALPAHLFRTTAAAPAARIFDPAFGAGYLTAAVLTMGLAALAARAVLGGRPGTLALVAAATAFSNIGYLGLPLVTSLVGAEAAPPLVVALTLDNVLVLAPAAALLEIERGAPGGPTGAARRALGGLLRNPMLLAVAAGALLAAARLPVPAPLEAFARLLGAAAGPCALFAVGATLAASAPGKASGPAALVVAGKLVLHPAVMWLVLSAFDLPPGVVAAAVLGAAMPVGSSVFVLGRQYDTAVEALSAAVLVSTLLAMGTVWLLAAVVAGR
jgi:predicted permease